jgi:hypothetical protein
MRAWAIGWRKASSLPWSLRYQSPFPIGLIYVHTSGPAEGDAMVAALIPWYRVRRVVAHSYLTTQ